MKKYKYTISTNTIWTSFDYGEVEAEDYADARKKAITELSYNFQKANDAFKFCDNTKDFALEFDPTQVEIEEIK